MTPSIAPTRLELAFKGERDYLQGGDIFNALAALTGARDSVVLQMNKVMRHALDAVPVPEGGPAVEFNALFEYDGAGGRHSIAVVEDGSAEVTSRKPYDEAAVVADARLSGERIFSPGPSETTFIERAIALNKVLLNARFAPAKIKWWFARLELDRVPISPRSAGVAFVASVGGRIAKSALEADGDACGFIYFLRDRT
jgi:hypothetical protein